MVKSRGSPGGIDKGPVVLLLMMAWRCFSGCKTRAQQQQQQQRNTITTPPVIGVVVREDIRNRDTTPTCPFPCTINLLGAAE